MPADIESYVSEYLDCTPAASVWCFSAGIIKGEGKSHYHWHPDYVCIHILCKGKGVVWTPNEERKLGPGDMFTLWPGIEIEYYKDAKDPWLVQYIHVKGPGAKNFGQECGFSDQNSFVSPNEPMQVIKDFKDIFECLKAGDSIVPYRSQSLLYRVIGHCRGRENIRFEQNDTFVNLVKRTQMLIEATLDSGVNINELAASMLVSRTTLFKAFRKVMGISPMQYLSQCRLARAKKLLRENDYPLAKVAKMSGFSDVKYFKKRFRIEEKIPLEKWLDS